MFKKTFAVLVAGALGVAGAAYAATFADADANGDGALSQDEFMAAYPDAGDAGWTAADANGDGSVTEDELQAAIDAGAVPAG
jgi:hypothetical protein